MFATTAWLNQYRQTPPSWNTVPTLSASTTPPKAGTVFTAGIPSTTGVTIITTTFYRTWDDGDTLEEIVGTTSLYTVGSGDPDPSYQAVAGDVGYSIMARMTANIATLPVIDTDLSAEVEEDVSGTVVPTLDTSKIVVEQRDWNDTTAIGRSSFTIVSDMPAFDAGWELLVARQSTATPQPSLAKTLLELTGSSQDTRPLTWNPNNGQPANAIDYFFMWWRQTGDPTLYPVEYIPDGATDPVPFSYQVLIQNTSTTPPPTSTDVDDFPTANQTLSAGTNAALMAAINARIASGSTATWIIDCPPGNYGFINIDGKVLPGKTYLRGQGLGAYTFKCTGGSGIGAQNITFQFLFTDRTGLPMAGDFSNCWSFGTTATQNVAFEYCDFYAGPSVLQTSANEPDSRNWNRGYHYGVENMISLQQPSGGVSRFRVYMSSIRGACQRGIYLGGTVDSEFSDIVFVDIGGDDIQSGHQTSRCVFKNLWFSRYKFPKAVITSTGRLDWTHTDSVQFDSPTPADSNQHIGNVLMMGDWASRQGGFVRTAIPMQGPFGRPACMTNGFWDSNIILTNTPNGILYKNDAGGLFGNATRQNTLCLLADNFTHQSHSSCIISLPGTVAYADNYMNRSDSGEVHGTGGTGPGQTMYVNTTQTAKGAANALYYGSPTMGATFYEFRPVSGRPTHWQYPQTATAVRKGAWERFRDIIENGAWPQVGSARTYFQSMFDWKDQLSRWGSKWVVAGAAANTVSIPTHRAPSGTAKSIIIGVALRTGSTTAPSMPSGQGWTDGGTFTSTTASGRWYWKYATTASESFGTATNADRVVCFVARLLAAPVDPIGGNGSAATASSNTTATWAASSTWESSNSKAISVMLSLANTSVSDRTDAEFSGGVGTGAGRVRWCVSNGRTAGWAGFTAATGANSETLSFSLEVKSV